MRSPLEHARSARRMYRQWAYSHLRGARTKLFDTYARENFWGDPETISGPGSNLEQTRAIREELPRLWAELGIRRLADVPCGDFYWMTGIVDRLDYYFGGDIAPFLVERARERAPDWCEFAVFDLMTDTFPPVDAILVRDVLGCLSNHDVHTILRNVCRSSARYLSTTTFTTRGPSDTVTGGWRFLNLAAPPFSFPEPVDLIDERSTHDELFADKSLATWEIDTLRQHLDTVVV